jgi:hypothetical protein
MKMAQEWLKNGSRMAQEWLKRLSKFVKVQNPETGRKEIFTRDVKRLFKCQLVIQAIHAQVAGSGRARHLQTVKCTLFHLEHNSKKFGMTA